MAREGLHYCEHQHRKRNQEQELLDSVSALRVLRMLKLRRDLLMRRAGPDEDDGVYE